MPDEEHLHPLGTCEKCKVSGSTPTNQKLHFKEPSSETLVLKRREEHRRKGEKTSSQRWSNLSRGCCRSLHRKHEESKAVTTCRKGEKPCEKILRSKITGLGDTEVGCAERNVGSQNKSRFLAWVTSFKSGERDLLYHCTDKCANVCLNLETLNSVYKPAWSLPDSRRLYFNAFIKQHSCEMHPCAFFWYILQLYFSVMHLGKLYKQKSIQIQSLGRRGRL